MFDRAKFSSDKQSYLTFVEMEKGLSSNTIDSYKQQLDKLQRYLQKKKHCHLKLSDSQIIEFIKLEAQQGISLATQSHLISVLKGFYKYLVSERDLESNPVSNLEFPKKWNVLPHYLSIQQVKCGPAKAVPAHQHPMDAEPLLDQSFQQSIHRRHAGCRPSRKKGLDPGKPFGDKQNRPLHEICVRVTPLS